SPCTSRIGDFLSTVRPRRNRKRPATGRPRQGSAPASAAVRLVLRGVVALEPRLTETGLYDVTGCVFRQWLASLFLAELVGEAVLLHALDDRLDTVAQLGIALPERSGHDVAGRHDDPELQHRALRRRPADRGLAGDVQVGSSGRDRLEGVGVLAVALDLPVVLLRVLGHPLVVEIAAVHGDGEALEVVEGLVVGGTRLLEELVVLVEIAVHEEEVLGPFLGDRGRRDN